MMCLDLHAIVYCLAGLPSSRANTSIKTYPTCLMSQYKGQQGVELAVKLLQEEFTLTMQLAGYVAIILFSGVER